MSKRVTTEAEAETDPDVITAIRQQTIPKLSERAIGRMAYQVGVGASGIVYIAVSGNEGGGYFSREWVSLARIQAVLAGVLEAGEPFATPLLRAAYRNQSVNNGGFLAAVLRHEGLLIAADPPHLHVCAAGWADWEAEQRRAFEAGERMEIPDPDATAVPAKKLTRGRKRPAVDQPISPDVA